MANVCPTCGQPVGSRGVGEKATIGIIVVCSLVLLPVRRVMSPFQSMYGEIGAELPALTRIALSGWWVPLLIALPLGLVGLTFVGGRAPELRRRLLMVAMVVCLTGLAATIIAMYLPVLLMSSAITG